MAHPMDHAISATRKWGGESHEYIAIENWLDGSKAFHGDIRHRALRHHAEGIFMCEQIFGIMLTLSTGRQVPVRAIAERHVIEDLGWIPSVSDWLKNLTVQPWMNKPKRLKFTMEIPGGDNKEGTVAADGVRQPSSGL